MKTWVLDGGLGLANLSLTERPDPRPGPGEVRLEMAAASLNFRDTLVVNGLYMRDQPLPLVPLSDGAGRVAELGEGVTGLAEGELVTPVFNQGWTAGAPSFARLSRSLGAGRTQGVAAEQVVVPAAAVVRAPRGYTPEQAACLPCAGVTAWAALAGELPVTPGATVLIQGTGGVSLFALQIARALGCRVVATTSSPEKAETLRSLGAAHVIDYRQTPDWGGAVRAWAGGEGVDQIIEVGGAGTLEQSLKAIRIGGTIAVIGVLSGAEVKLSVPHMLMGHVRLQGITVGSRDHHADFVRFIENTGLAPVIDRRFALDDLPGALQHMIARQHVGKITLGLGAG
ncbi:hypothetical protein CCR85_11150 [Rhodothalassium salexigens]|uniref:zinc-dependent alcohol dehydrogenase family protein n=1 Tax=Rhodothalassium salexigens TaxID=1086 RepID=UPI0019142003|nr:NAD(P)-dependent alcohol dehydrogenase [Rhodothalassium salexigens]MBK5912045.1 hypothetical protein [Rhodothalassium salexigens]